jgi:tetratricopeptide (TPR) repeat protein
MAVLPLKNRLNSEERAAVRRLILQDATALLSLLAVVIVLSTLTYFLFQSFQDHRQELAQRWTRRGEQALAGGHPETAVNALRSALAYIPSRPVEIELAEALAQSGRIQEAVAYFNTLRESEPGNGIINLQLARLAARQNQKTLAINYYQTALDGTWQGDGYQRRRDVRLEMAAYLIDIHDLDHARDQLLIAAGNAPDRADIKLKIARLLEQCESPADALEIYRSVARQRNAPWAAFAGAGRTAFALGRYALAKDFLERTVADRALNQQPQAMQAEAQQQLNTSRQVLALYPAADLTLHERAARVLHDVNVARARYLSCEAPPPPPPPPPKDGATKPETNPSPAPAAAAASNVTGPVNSPLVARWTQIPKKLTILSLEQDPEMAQTLMQLVFDTEKDAALHCGAPQGEDALLLRIAQAPYVVEQR